MSKIKLSEYKIAEREVELPGGEITFTVRGLSLADITVLVRHHSSDLNALFDRFVNREKDTSADDVAQDVAHSLLTMSPDIAAAIIATATGDASDDVIAIAKGLSMPVQMDALMKIGDLTFTTEMPPKKAFETVVDLLQKGRSQIENSN